MLIALLQQVAPPMPRRYWVVDAFAGEMAISKAFRARGYPSLPLDICRNPNDESSSAFATRYTCKRRDTYTCLARSTVAQDILSSCGFLRHLRAVLNLREGGLLTMGPCLQLLGADKLLFASSHGARIAFGYIRGAQISSYKRHMVLS